MYTFSLVIKNVMHDACIFHDIVVIPFLYIYIDILRWGKNKETVLSSLPACFVITHSFLLSRIFVTIVSLLYNFYIIGEAVNFNALFNCFAVRLCFCGGMRI